MPRNWPLGWEARSNHSIPKVAPGHPSSGVTPRTRDNVSSNDAETKRDGATTGRFGATKRTRGTAAILR